jgi:4'-phosphopantetheinyl transferase
MVFNGAGVCNVTTGDQTAPFATPARVTAPSDTTLLWWCSLAYAPGHAGLSKWLSDDERARMRRFGNDALRMRYLIGRASLRWVLAQTMGVTPAAVVIERGPRGRPQLAGTAGIDFNVSHTADVALIGISYEGRIGVDVERADRVIHSAGLARKVLTDRERAALPADDDAIRRRILRLWTCKEALAKATGDAMSAPFGRLDIATDPALKLVDGPPPYDPRDFALFGAAVPDGYLATVALWRHYNAGSKSSATGLPAQREAQRKA